MRRASFLLSSVLILSVSGPVGVAGAHYLSEDSVDNYEIRYEDYSKWDDAHNNAIAQWEALRIGVNIDKDSALSSTDLELRDYYSNDGRCGYWDGRTGADLLALNDRAFNTYGPNNRRGCAIHEWGHAHALAHSYDDQVMDDCPVSPCGSVFTSPQSHDRTDYDIKW